MDDDVLRQFDDIMCRLRKKIYSIQMPEFVFFDIDTTLLATYGHQEGILPDACSAKMVHTILRKDLSLFEELTK